MYPSDLKEEEWEIVKSYVIKNHNRGRKSVIDRRRIVDAIFYQTRTGCQWRLLPKDFPDYKIIMHYYYLWTRNGTWEKLHNDLVSKCRSALGKKKHSTYSRNY